MQVAKRERTLHGIMQVSGFTWGEDKHAGMPSARERPIGGPALGVGFVGLLCEWC